MIFVTGDWDARAIQSLAADLKARGGDPAAIGSGSIDMSPAFIKGVSGSLPNARIAFDKFHVIAHTSAAVDKMRRIEQKTDPCLKGLHWKLFRDYDRLSPESRSKVDALVAHLTTRCTARAWVYRENLREILHRKQINVVRGMLLQWATCVMRSKVEPMKEVARQICNHLEGIVVWAGTRLTHGFLEAISSLFPAAKREACGYGIFTTIRTVILLIAGKLDFSKINPHVGVQPT